MALTFGQSSNSNSEGYMGNGVYVDEVEIKSAVNATEDEKAKGFARDISIRVEVRVLKNDWNRTLTIGGNYKRDPQTKEIIDWGGAFKLKDLFAACQAPEEIDANGVPSQAMLDACVGKKLLTLTYTNNNGKYSTWNSVTSADRDPDKFAAYFMSQVKKGYPKNYQAPNSEAQPQNSTVATAVQSVSSESL